MKHDIWMGKDELPGVCISGVKECEQIMLQEGKKKIHSQIFKLSNFLISFSEQFSLLI